MLFHCESLPLQTTAPIEIIDISDRVRQMFEAHHVRNGQVTIQSPHTTAYIVINEREAMLQQDMAEHLSKLVPQGISYRHDRAPVDGRPNAHSHLLGLFMNASETIPVQDGDLLLGDWQSVFFIELDGPRERRSFRVQIVGEQ